MYDKCFNAYSLLKNLETLQKSQQVILIQQNMFFSPGHPGCSSRINLLGPRLHSHWRLPQCVSQSQAMRAAGETNGGPVAGGKGDWERWRSVFSHGGVRLSCGLPYTAFEAG